MTTTAQDLVSTLNNLIQTCYDAHEGFRAAADDADDPRLQTLFRDYSQQRQQLVDELRAEVVRHGGEPASTGSTSGAIHRGWMQVKSAIVGKDDEAIIAECERGEDVAVEQYREALKCDFPLDEKQLVTRQYAVVKATHDRIRELETSYSDST